MARPTATSTPDAEQQHVVPRRQRPAQERLQLAHEGRDQDDQPPSDDAMTNAMNEPASPKLYANPSLSEGGRQGTIARPMSRTRGLAALVVLYVVIAHLIPPPATITPQGWRQTAIFICVIAGMVTDPAPGIGAGADRPHRHGGQRHADARGARRLRRAVGVAGVRRDADRQGDARHRARPPHRACCSCGRSARPRSASPTRCR